MAASWSQRTLPEVVPMLRLAYSATTTPRSAARSLVPEATVHCKVPAPHFWCILTCWIPAKAARQAGSLCRWRGCCERHMDARVCAPPAG